MTDEPFGLDDRHDDPPATPPAADPQPDQEAAARSPVPGITRHRPYCPRHNCLMIATGSTTLTTRYKCPADGCDSLQQLVPKPRTRPPIAPLICPQCDDDVPMEVNHDHSREFKLLMECPRCHWDTYVPRPDLHYRAGRVRSRTILDR